VRGNKGASVREGRKGEGNSGVGMGQEMTHKEVRRKWEWAE